MRIESVNGMNTGMQPQMTQGMDAEEAGIQNQIKRKQQEMRELSENKDMSPEEKMKKRKEIQQEISELNMQLRQYQMQKKREQQNKGTDIEDMLGGKQNEASPLKKGQNDGLSQNGMEAMLSADSSLKQAKVQGSVANQMEGRAGVLKAEIKQDKGKGTEAKEEELAVVEKKAADAAAAHMNSLSDANKAAGKAAEAEKDSRKTEKSDKKDTEESDEKEKELSESKEEQTDVQNVPKRENTVSVDIRL